MGGADIDHDPRGNMTSDGARTYGYDYDNRLTSVVGGPALSWDPTSRLAQVGATRFLYDGPRVIAEYAVDSQTGASSLAKRYVHGAGVDEPLVWYGGTGDGARRFLATDERGSIVALATDAGVVTAANRYDAYGVPAGANLGRFQYTGQMWMVEPSLPSCPGT